MWVTSDVALAIGSVTALELEAMELAWEVMVLVQTSV